jgi:hypothetical protein
MGNLMISHTRFNGYVIKTVQCLSADETLRTEDLNYRIVYIIYVRGSFCKHHLSGIIITTFKSPKI